MKAGILIGHLSNKGNEGALIRTAEAFGVSNVFVIGKKQEVYRTAEGCDRHMNFFEFDKISDFLYWIANKNFKLVCVENTMDSSEIREIEKYPVNPIFITGNERTGVPKELIENASIVIRIKQGMGYANCLNTAVATGIIIHDFFKKELNKREELWERESPQRK